MADFGLQITGDSAVILRLDQFPDLVRNRLRTALQSIEQRLEAAIIAEEPSDTGALRNQTGGRVYEHQDRMAAVVGVRADSAGAAKKAAALEYGSRGAAITVAAHTQSLNHLWSRATSLSVVVQSYQRTPNLVAERFLRGPLDAMSGEALAELQAAVEQAQQDSEAV